MPGDHGKSGPVLIIKPAAYVDTTAVVVLPLTSDVSGERGPRVDLEPSPLNGLKKTSRLMVDKPGTVTKTKLGSAFGRLTSAEMSEVERALAGYLGFG